MPFSLCSEAITMTKRAGLGGICTINREFATNDCHSMRGSFKLGRTDEAR